MFARSFEAFGPISPRSFSTSSCLQKRPVRRRKRPGAKAARVDELEILRNLHSEISEVIKNWNDVSWPPSVETIAPESDSILPASATEFSQQSPPSESLPESFLPSRLGTRERQRKPRPKTEDKDRLELNPWAQALASPVRMCSATGIRLPSDLLLEYGVVQHPTNRSIWMLPTGLLEDQLQAYKANSTPSPQNYPVFRLPNALSIINEVNSQSKKRILSKVLPHQWRPYFGGRLTKAEAENAVWRKDMPAYVLHHMRNKVVKKLKELAQEREPEVWSRFWSILDLKNNREDGLQDAMKKTDGLERVNWGAVVILHSNTPDHSKPVEDRPTDSALSSEGPSDSPSITATTSSTLSEFPGSAPTPSEGSRVPVFDLTKLLSGEHLAELRSSAKLFQNRALFLRPGRPKAADLLLRLWNLKLYCTI